MSRHSSSRNRRRRRQFGRRLWSFIWKGGPVLGVILLGLYFLRIGHVPLDAIEDLLSVGIVVAFLSALILLALVIYSAAPILPVLAAIASKQREEWTAWFGVQGRFRTVAFALATVCAPWLALFVMFVPMEGAPLESKWWICTALLCGSLAVLAEYALTHPTADHGPIPPPKARWILFRFCGAIACAALAVLPLLVFFLLITHSKFSGEEDPVRIWLLFVAGAGMTALAHAAALRMTVDASKTHHAMYGSAGVMVFLLVVQTHVLDAWASLHNRVMSIATVRLERVHLVLKEDACAGLPLVGIEPAFNGDTKTCALYEVTVLSRLGERWPIACRFWRPSDPRQVTSAVIPADDVLEWHPLAERAQPPAEQSHTCQLDGISGPAAKKDDRLKQPEEPAVAGSP